MSDVLRAISLTAAVVLFFFPVLAPVWCEWRDRRWR